MNTSHLQKTLAFAIIALFFVACSKPDFSNLGTASTPNGSVRETDDDRTSSPQFQTYLMGRNITDYGPLELERAWVGDLGVIFRNQDEIHIVTGDVLAGDAYAEAPQAYAVTTEFDPTALNMAMHNWQPFAQTGFANPVHDRISGPTLAPTGAIVIGTTIYLFMMDMTHWLPELQFPGEAARCY